MIWKIGTEEGHRGMANEGKMNGTTNNEVQMNSIYLYIYCTYISPAFLISTLFHINNITVYRVCILHRKICSVLCPSKQSFRRLYPVLFSTMAGWLAAAIHMISYVILGGYVCTINKTQSYTTEHIQITAAESVNRNTIRHRTP